MQPRTMLSRIERLQNRKKSFVMISVSAVFIVLCLIALYFSSEAARFSFNYTSSKEALESVEQKLQKIETVVKDINAYSDAIDELTMSTIDVNGDRSVSADIKLARVEEVIQKLKSVSANVSSSDSIENRMEELSVSTDRMEKTLKSLVTMLRSRKEVLESLPSITPVVGWISSGFGKRKSPFTGKNVKHMGLDIGADEGASVYASADGEVAFVGTSPTFGKVVVIKHPYNFVTKYAHNSKILVRKGQKIKRGDLISLVGSTGRSTGPHLHYEVWSNTKPMDPETYLLDRELDKIDLATASEGNTEGIGGEEYEIEDGNSVSVQANLVENNQKQKLVNRLVGPAKLKSMGWKRLAGFGLLGAIGVILGGCALLMAVSIRRKRQLALI